MSTKLVEKRASELVNGDRVVAASQTLWGWTQEVHTACRVHCELDTRLVYVELRVGESLRFVLRLNPGDKVKVEAPKPSAQIISLAEELAKREATLTRREAGEVWANDSGQWWGSGI